MLATYPDTASTTPTRPVAEAAKVAAGATAAAAPPGGSGGREAVGGRDAGAEETTAAVADNVVDIERNRLSAACLMLGLSEGYELDGKRDCVLHARTHVRVFVCVEFLSFIFHFYLFFGGQIKRVFHT